MGEGQQWTFLFTDIEGSTVLWEREPDAMKDALARHDALLRACVEAGGGRVFGLRGDGLAAAFDAPGPAVRAALAAQRELAAERWPAGLVLAVRMGLHHGPAAPRDGDLYGPHVNLAARVMSAAAGSQVLVSEAVCRRVAGPAEAGGPGPGPGAGAGPGSAAAAACGGLRFEALGSYHLRGIEAPVALFGAHDDRTPWRSVPVNAVPVRRTNLPAQHAPLVGRAELVARAVDLLDRHRLVTLCGAGGIGKTAVALAVAAARIDRHGDGAWLVELAAVEPGAAAPAERLLDVLATALRVPPGAGAAAARIAGWLEGRQLLVVLDTCEHLADTVRAVLDGLLEAAPGLTVLATSRVRLGHRAERLLAVDPLVPSAARALLCERAASLDAMPTGDADPAAVERLCARLDGMPLAIELAAAQLRWLAPGDVLAGLDAAAGDPLCDPAVGAAGAGAAAVRPFDTGGLDGVAMRHVSVQAAMNWSYRLLDDPARAVLRRLSVLAGGGDRRAALAVGRGEDLDDAAAERALRLLVEHSLVLARPTPLGMRYRLLDPIREAAGRRLEAAAEQRTAAAAQAAWYATAAEAADALVHSTRQLDGDAAFDADWDNIRAAHDWAVRHGDAVLSARILAATEQHAYHRVRHELGEWARQALAAPDTASPVARAIACRWAVLAGDYDAALRHAEDGVAGTAAEAGPVGNVLAVRGLAGCWAMLAHIHAMSGRSPAAKEAAGRTEALAARLGDGHGRQLALFARSFAGLGDDWPSVRAARRALIADQERVGSPRMRANAAVQRAMLARLQKPPDLDSALALCRAGTTMARSAGSVFDEAQSLLMAAVLAATLERPDAVDDCAEALAFVRRTGYGVFLG
ncbi:MAG: adenylate/guanylate cyclase domain-containing protein, partial [Acidimicrobiia bacterium]